MITYAEATATKTAEEEQADTIAALAADGVTVTGFSPASVERGQIALHARARSYERELLAEITKAGFLVDVQDRDPAWLDRLLEGLFAVSRLRATRARHILTLTNQSSTGGPYEIKAARTLEASTLDGIRFRNIEGGTLNAGIGEELRLEFEATIAGTAGNVGPGEVYKLMSGAIPGVDITNELDSQTFVARDDETNVEYARRALARWGTLAAGGHPTAVEFRILSGVETITKLGVRDDNPFGPGTVAVYLANSAGPATGAECLAAQAVFGPYEPLGSRGLWYYLPAVANTVTVTVTLELDGSNANAVTEAESALADLAAMTPMKAGQKLDTALLQGILRGGKYDEVGIAGPRGVVDVDMTTPSADIVLGVDEVLVLVPALTEA